MSLTASATLTVNGETVYPYEPGKLEYYRTGDLCSSVNGTVISSSLIDYLQVSQGQVLVRIFFNITFTGVPQSLK